MASPLLPVIESNAAYDVEQALPLVLQGRMPREYMGVLWKALRIRGICALFLDYDREAFHEDLQKSATFYLHYLKNIAEEADKITSESAPFFDAAACKDVEAAREISRYARATWNQGLEYEDDFLYVRFLMTRCFLDSDDEAQELLDALKIVLDGAPSPRFDVCQALMERDATAFDEALALLILEHEERYSTGRASGYVAEEEWATDGLLFVEGLALVAMAEILRLPVQDDYLFIPSVARAASERPHQPDAWRVP